MPDNITNERATADKVEPLHPRGDKRADLRTPVQALSQRILEISNRHTLKGPMLQEIVREIQAFTGCAAVGIRILDERGNIPYEAYVGFSQEFYERESPLSLKSDECMCINVIRGVPDPALPFYTPGGSFFMNGSTRFLATVSERDKGQTRDACNEHGYESVALIPLRVSGDILGLIHVADPRENMVPRGMVETLEGIGLALGVAVRRVLAEERLEANEQRYRQLVENAGFGIGYYDPEGRILHFKRQALMNLGIRLEDCVGRTAHEVFGTRWGDLICERIKRVCQSPESLEFEDEVDLPTGTRWYLSRYTRVPDAKGQCVGALIVSSDITERKRAEETLRLLSSRQEAILAAVPDIIAEVDAHRVYTWMNRAGFEFFGDDALGKEAAFYFEGQQDTYGVVQPVFNGDTAVIYVESWQRRRDGEKRLLAWWCRVLQDGRGNVVGALSTARDITERKQAEESLVRANRSLRTIGKCREILARGVPESELLDGLCRVFVSEGGYTMAWIGYAEANAEKTVRPVAQAGHTDGYLEAVKITWSEAPTGQGPTGKTIRTGKPHVVRDIQNEPSYGPWRAEARKRGYASSIALPLATGTQRFGALNVYAAQPDAFDPSEVDLLSHLADDIARGVAASRAQEALRKSEEKYRELVENLNDVIFAIDVAGVITYVSPPAEQLTGYAPEELVGHPFREIIHADDLPQLNRSFRDTMENRLEPWEFRYRNREGQIRWARTSSRPILEGERTVGIRGLFTDITARKEAECQILDYQNRLRGLMAELGLAQERERRRIAVGVHDQIGQRMALVKLALQSWQAALSDPDARRPLQDVIREIDQVIADAHALTFDLSNPILHEAGFEAAVEAWLAEQVQARHGIACTFAGSRPKVQFDKDISITLFQTVRELLANVVKHAQATQVDVRIRRSGERVRITVRDNGSGFDPARAIRFDPRSGGYGLFGMRERLTYLGGELQIESAPGQGTCVTILIPVQSSDKSRGKEA